MHRKVIKISSGGVHNICIVDPYPHTIMQDVYQSFIQGKYCDVVFKGFYTTTTQNEGKDDNLHHGYNITAAHNTNLNLLSNLQSDSTLMSHPNGANSSDEEMKDEFDFGD